MKWHDKAVDVETVERYVRHQLAGEELRMFEEHLIECSECFEQTQEMERFIAGVRHSAAAGRLTPQRSWMPRFVPVFAGGFLLVVAIAGVSIWTLTKSLRESRQENASLAQQVRQGHASAGLAQQRGELLAGNLPLVILQASRAQTEQEIAVSPASRQIALWIEVAPGSQAFAVEVSTTEGRLVQRADGLKGNRYHALAVVLPAEKIPPGHYIVRLFADNPRQLRSEYLLKVTSE
jgi:hypothetical protein